jgi:hypothetical protein
MGALARAQRALYAADVAGSGVLELVRALLDEQDSADYRKTVNFN